MPIYEYRCGQCGLEKEYLQKVNDAPIAVCPSCGASAMVKLISAAGFQLKGSGWYVTDFKNGSAKAPPAKPAAAESKPAEATPAATTSTTTATTTTPASGTNGTTTA